MRLLISIPVLLSLLAFNSAYAQNLSVVDRAIARRDFAEASKLASEMSSEPRSGWLPLYVRGYAHLDQGRSERAEHIARQLDDSGARDPRITHLLINALIAQGKERRAVFLIRRNIDKVDPAMRAEYRKIHSLYLRMHPQEGISLSGGLTPSTNITKGTEAETVYLNGLPFRISSDTRQVGGATAAVSATAFRRFQTGEATELVASVTAGTEQGLQGTQTSLLTLSPRLKFVVYQGRHSFWAGPLSEFQWQSGHPYALRGGLAAGASFVLSPSDQVRISAKVVSQKFPDQIFLDGHRLEGDISWNHRFPEALDLTIGAGVTRERRRANHLSHTDGRASVSLGKTWSNGLYTNGSISWETAAYDTDFPLLSEPRQDSETALQIGIAHERIQLYGVVPYVGLRHIRHQSNVPIYRYISTDLVLSARKRF